MKKLDYFLNEAKQTLKPTDTISYFVSDYMVPTGTSEDFKSEEELVLHLLVQNDAIDKKDIKKIKLSKVKENNNGNLEFHISGTYKVLKNAVEQFADGEGYSIDELIDKGEITID